MKIAGIDYSKNSPAVVVAELDEDLDITGFDYIGFSTVKKVATSDNKIVYYKKADFRNDIDGYLFMRDKILPIIEDVDYIAFEGYAFGGTGKVFDIAEATSTTKVAIYEKEKNLRIYEPTVIKMFGHGKGNAGKVEMNDSFKKVLDEDKPNWNQLPELKSPKEDLIDAYFITKLLQTELKLRHGMVELKSLPLKHIEIFNRCTKSNPVNILSRDFLRKEV